MQRARAGHVGTLTDRQLDSISGIISGGRQLLDQVGEILTYARGAANQTRVDLATPFGVAREQRAVREILLAHLDDVHPRAGGPRGALQQGVEGPAALTAVEIVKKIRAKEFTAKAVTTAGRASAKTGMLNSTAK